MADKATESVDSDVSADLAALREDFRRLSDSLSTLLRAQADSADATIRGVVGDAAGQASQAAASAQDSALTALADLERRIEKNPLTAVLIAAGIGLVVGMLSRSRG